jgi:DNA-binding transcriptional regulator YiaG
MDVSELRARAVAKQTLPPPWARRAIREAAGCSQEDVARHLGVNRVTVSRWEKGERTPRRAHLLAYVAVLDVLRGASAGDAA